MSTLLVMNIIDILNTFLNTFLVRFLVRLIVMYDFLDIVMILIKPNFLSFTMLIFAIVMNPKIVMFLVIESVKSVDVFLFLYCLSIVLRQYFVRSNHPSRIYVLDLISLVSRFILSFTIAYKFFLWIK
jgi:hypothetical protein